MTNREQKEWTLMFYFASDNPLAPGVVSQLKAIKDAGLHPNANVITQFDPRTVGTPTHIFDVNIIEKLKRHGGQNIGFDSNDPFVRTLLEDKLWRTQRTRRHHENEVPPLIRDKYKELLNKRYGIEDYNPPVPPNGRSARESTRRGVTQEPSPKESLENFLDFCRNKYPAKHYMLFILGHGIVVGNDIFLFDEHAEVDSLTLIELGEVLSNFKEEITPEGGTFELISFHSCSVSSLEVAYELEGTANYMLATQGPAFVGSWPYRQILIRIFNDLLRCGSHIDIKEMIVKIFYYCLYNSTDFLMAGYSFDLCLCDLNKVSTIKEPLRQLSKALSDALVDPETGETNLLARDFIQLAHLKSQSYWQERYTDIYDFCSCFRKLYEQYKDRYRTQEKLIGSLQPIYDACWEVMSKLKKEGRKIKSLHQKSYDKRPVNYENEIASSDKEGTRENDGNKSGEELIVRAEFAGPEFQYSHGLSVFFPWVEPSSDDPIWSRPLQTPPFVGQYEKYKFADSHWRCFLVNYFDATRRLTRRCEDSPQQCSEKMPMNGGQASVDDQWIELMEDMASLVYNDEGQLSQESGLQGKPGPSDPTGDDCSCPSIKNYPRDTRSLHEKNTQADDKSFPMSDTFFDKLE